MKIITALIIVFLIIFLSSGFYFVKFYNNIYAINDILEKDSKSYECNYDSFKKLVTIFEGKCGIIRFVSENVLFRIGFNCGKNVPWQIKKSIMMMFLFVYYSEDQIFALWCHFVSFEDKQNIFNIANSLFEKEFDQLTVNELAKLVVFSRTPRLSEIDSEKFNQMVNTLLSKYSRQ